MDIQLVSHCWLILHTHNGNIKALFASAPKRDKNTLATIAAAFQWSKKKRVAAALAGLPPNRIYEEYIKCS